LLLVNQDLRRFNDIKVHLERMAKATESHHEANHFADYDSWHEDSAWYDDEWSYDDYYDDDFAEEAGVWYEEWHDASDWLAADDYASWLESSQSLATGDI